MKVYLDLGQNNYLIHPEWFDVWAELTKTNH